MTDATQDNPAEDLGLPHRPGPPVGAPVADRFVERGGAATRPPPGRRVAIHPRTLLLIRWIAVIGQAVAVLTVHDALGFEVALIECFAAIAALALSNVWLWITAPPGPGRMAEGRAALVMAFDLVQLGVLLGFTGGLANPFSILILGPVVVAATILSRRSAAWMIALATVIATGLAVLHYPLPWGTEPLTIPPAYILGVWTALAVSFSFIGAYIWSVTDDSRRLSAALAETESALARERETSAVGALAAAAAHELGSPLATIAVVTKDLKAEVHPDDPLREDIELLHEQSQRCRDILVGLERRPRPDAGPGDKSTDPFERLTLTGLIETAAENHVPERVEFAIVADEASEGTEPWVLRRPELLHGLGNLISNAGQFARRRVEIRLHWTAERVSVTVKDDGPGFAPHVLQALGEPYMSTRAGRDGHLGLGVFIATTLLESVGGRLAFRNRRGAEATVEFDRQTLAQGAENST